jgi:hypothetical protein
MKNIQNQLSISSSLACIILIQLSITIQSSGFLAPTKIERGKRTLNFNTLATGNYDPIQSQMINGQRHRLFTSSSSQNTSENRRSSLSEDQVHELLSGGLRKGQPSYPAWKSKRRRRKLNEMTEWATSDEANRPIVCEYEPDALWLWTRWRGTALSMTYMPVVFNIAIGILVNWFIHSHTATTWTFFSVPPPEDPLIMELAGLKTLWEYQLTLCTFILAFFTSQAYSYWRSVYFTTRAIQGRINDICLIITTNAERKAGKMVDGKNMTDYSFRAAELVATCTRLIRVSHTL